MAISAIHDWLAAKGNYQHGIELLKLHGRPTAAQAFIFTLAESPVTRDKLVTALRAVNEQAGAAIPVPVSLAKPKKDAPVTGDAAEAAFNRSLSTKPPSDLPEHMLPPALRPLRAQLSKWHTEMTLLRGMMMKMPDGHELYDIGAQIKALHKRLKKGWLVIETYRATGNVVLPTEPTAANNHADWLRELQKVRVWLSQRAPDAKPKPRPGTPEEIAAKVARRDELTKLIHNAAEGE